MPRYRRSPIQRIVTIVIILAIVGFRLWSEHSSNSDGSGAQPGTAQQTWPESSSVRVVRVVDGDTLIMGQDNVRVRLQGIDTPETVKEDTPVEPWGPEATQYTKRFVADAGDVLRVEVDGEAEDKYGRRLVFLWNNDRLLNRELVEQGLARAKLAYDYSQAKKDVLKQAEREAQRARRGIWSAP